RAGGARRLPRAQPGGGGVMRRLALAAAAGLSLAGCGASLQPLSADRVTTTRPATHDIASFTWNLPAGEPYSLARGKCSTYSENRVAATLCDSLLRLEPQRRIARGRARSFSHPAPTRWVYTLRDGVRFWDGAPLTAQDVVYSLRRHMDPDSGSL